VRPQRLVQQRLTQQRMVEQRVRQQRLRQAAGLGRPPLLDDKLRVPRLSLEVLRRRRVTGLIEAAVTRRVTVVSGPAGAGKTVACAAWAAARGAARQPAWLTVDADDRDPARFWPYVLAALVRVRAVAADEAGQLAGAPPEAYPPCLVAATRGLAEPVVLVIDDVHELAGSPALAGLSQLIKHAPAGLRLVLAGRGQPGLALARLRVAGDVAEVGADDLACTPEEADAYVSMLGLELTPSQRADLLGRTEGWMAGLRLAVMASPAPASAPGMPAPAVLDYVRDEVLGGQSPQTRAFLLQTCVAASLPGGLADALTERSGTGARTLERLTRENILVTSGEPGSYRYHPMLREVLAADLRRERPGELPVLLGRAARWHAARDQAVEAVRAAGQAGDWDFGVHLLAQAGAGVMAPDRPAELESVLAAFPPEYRAGAAPVAAALAAARLWQGDADGAAPHLDCALRSAAALDAGLLGAVGPWITALAVMQGASPAGGVAGAWAEAERAAAAASTVPQYRAAGLLWYAIGCDRLRRWEARPAVLALGRASARLAAGSLPGLRARALAWQALAAASCGELAAAEKLGTEAASVAGADRAVAAPLALARAEVFLARDELDAAAAQLDEAGRLAGGQAAGEPDVAGMAGLIRARAAAAESDPAAAAPAIARLRAAAPADEGLGRLLAALEATSALAAGERERAGLILDSDSSGAAGPAAGPAPPWAAGGPAAATRLGRARLLLATGDDKGALESVDGWLDGTDPAATLRLRVSALLIAAVARRRLSQVTVAAEHIEQALLLAEPEGAYRVFLDGGPSVRSAMTVLVPPTSRSAGFAGRVLERFDGQPPRLAAAGAAGAAGLPLTGSELAVLRFLPSHMTNQEIAEALFLSINTVKTHLRSAYRKLGVVNRRQAIARGRRLDLL
jgi:LuxR family maltose regulon positive regulatory protein